MYTQGARRSQVRMTIKWEEDRDTQSCENLACLFPFTRGSNSHDLNAHAFRINPCYEIRALPLTHGGSL